MTINLLDYILETVVSAVSLEFFFIPVIAMAVFGIVVRLFLRRYY